MKIDVEGHEYEVLAGAQAIFASGRVASSSKVSRV